MAISPALHLHFEVSNDCTKCCPRRFRCLCCCEGEEEVIVNKERKLAVVARASRRKRIEVNDYIYNELIPAQLGDSVWEEIKPELGIDVDREIRAATPVTPDRLQELASSVNRMMLKYSSEVSDG